MSTELVYKKIGQLDFKELVEFLEHNNTEIIIKVNSQFTKAHVTQIIPEKAICISKFSDYEFSNEPITCLFHFKDEMYFFSTHLNNSKAEYHLDLPSEIFQYQRRNDYRVTMPIGQSYVCKIIFVQGNPKNIQTEIRDLSLGGFQLSVPAYLLNISEGSEFDITLAVDTFEFPQLKMIAKHIKTIEEQDSLLIGAQFVDLANDAREMQGLLMHLHRKSRSSGQE
jgi:c-di-GMP-binding flagellar brake protein YcgR